MELKILKEMSDSRVGTDKVQHEPGASYGVVDQQRPSHYLAVKTSRTAPVNSSGQQRLILRYRVNL